MLKQESNKDYHSNGAVSKSTLAKMSVNPQYYKWCLDNPQPPSDDLIFGSAFHKLVLEPQDFDKEFAILPECNRRTKDGKALYDDFMAKCYENGQQAITQDDYNVICAMRDSVMSNKYAVALLKGNHEQSMYWVDNFTQIECKCRLDCYKALKGHIIITDLKSCRSADIKSIEKDVVQYAYDLQSFMYSQGVSENLKVPIENIDFMFVFVEKKAPYQINIVQANEYVRQRGENLFREYIGTLKYCRESGNYYGYMGAENLPNELSLPSYLLKDIGE